MTAALVASLEGLDVLLCEKSDPGRRYRRHLRRHALDSRQQPEQGGRLRRQRASRRPLSLRADRGGHQSRSARGLSPNRPAGDRLSRCQDRRAVPTLRHPSRLPQQHAGRGGCRPRHRAGAVRRPPAGQGFQASASAHPGIHAARRHDDRQSRHRPAHRPLPIVGQFPARRQTVRALFRRPPALSARHPSHHGQCAGRPALLQPAPAQGADPVRRRDRRAHRRPRGRHRRASANRQRRDRDRGTPGRGAGNRRLRPQ